MRGSRGDLGCDSPSMCGSIGERGERDGWGNGRWAAGATARGAAGAAAVGLRGQRPRGWTLWMWQNRAPRLAVNAYIRCLISSRDEHVDDIYSRYSNVII
jgi:hypothetical protein